MNELDESKALPARAFEPAPAPHYPPPPPIPAEAPLATAASFRTRATHPLLGPSFWVFGALTWSYVVVGELVVHLALPEVLGVLLVIACTGYAWVVASGLADGVPFAANRLLSLALGCVLFVALVSVTVSLLGSHRPSHVAAVTVLLWFSSVIAFLLGRRWTARQPGPRSTGDRLRSAAIWTLTVIATLVAMISAMDRM